MEAKLSYPPNADLRHLLRFDPESGAIWLGERRMLLLHTAALSGLRQDLIHSVGPVHARRLLTRMGYASGRRDAEFARTTRGALSLDAAFLVGPQLHMLEGAACVTPIQLDFDAATGRFSGEFRWDNSWEAHAHRHAFGLAETPACWVLLGYASGYTSAFMGRLIVFKETCCAACGADHCQIVGRPVDEWPDAAEQRQYFEDDSLLDTIAALNEQVQALVTTIESAGEPGISAGMLVGASPAFQEAHALLNRAAATQVTVLLTGETGVGKERFARALHQGSARAGGPFIAVNCAALPADLIEAELFGVERGAYTGAHVSRSGRFERADGGTLFLDEVGDLPLPLQAKLLRVLQDGEIERLGAETARKVNVRLVTATNVDLEAAVSQGRFRRDLLYRLNVYPICIPPLRERTADIEPLANHLLARFSALHQKRLSGISERAMQALVHHDWPGNVRELENLIERGVILSSQGGTIELEHLFPHRPPGIQATVSARGRLAPVRPDSEQALCVRILDSGLSLESLESQLLELAVERAGGNLSGAARHLGLTRPQLAYRLKRQEDKDSEA
ncbi:sigma-54-dependent Fis family transcriptional regulator [Cupriavidus pinatubonensis]|uniref:sigma-54-dependent Fis family transcriptional regulator n=1 Tax=Cupriavidus pinatubonensis TaxID=248026 RepID=UPI00112E76CD|nr:sigma-54-dependent Fis family transcriptional regulator [Cupriavidus pinatubonensis]TPQ33497.1 sigma-54-dependent Fis family transcriptional regulator [Cupriavidus pinatubonensis]